ncbi:MAG TPA: aquaporin [Acidimicrobiia bacterium]
MVINKYLAELLGTMILVAVGSLGILAVGGAGGPAEVVAIAFAFGLALFAAISALGHVSGGHFNPAVTLGMLVDRRIGLSDAIGYWVGQIAGGIVGSLIILAAADQDAVAMTNTTYGDLTTAIVVEVLLAAVFVWVIMAVTRGGGSHVPLTIGLTLVMVHLAAIPLSGASVNPARSFGPAVVSGEFGNIGVYLYAPLIGGIVAAILYRLFPSKE